MAGPSSDSACIRIKRAPYTTVPTLPLEQWTLELELTDELAITGIVPGTRRHARVACLNGASTMKNLAFAEARPRYLQ